MERHTNEPKQQLAPQEARVRDEIKPPQITAFDELPKPHEALTQNESLVEEPSVEQQEITTKESIDEVIARLAMHNMLTGSESTERYRRVMQIEAELQDIEKRIPEQKQAIEDAEAEFVKANNGQNRFAQDGETEYGEPRYPEDHINPLDRWGGNTYLQDVADDISRMEEKLEGLRTRRVEIIQEWNALNDKLAELQEDARNNPIRHI